MKTIGNFRVVITTLLAICFLYALTGTSTAASLIDAKSINFDQAYQGVLKNYDQEDYYKFTTTGPGNVTLSIKNKSGSQLHGEVLNSSGKIYEDIYTDDSEMVSGYSTAEVGLPAGTYYIKIGDSYNSSNQRYEFKVNYKASNFYEKEFNDSISISNSISVNQTYNGNLRDYEDKDFYKFTIAKPGNVKLEIKQKSGSTWYGHIQDSNGKVYEDLYTDDSEMITGNTTAEVGLPAGTYYVKIENSNYAYDTPYQFKIAYSGSDYYEKEFNDSITYSNPLSLNKTYKGSLQEYDDNDFYKFTISKAGNITLSVKQQSGSVWYAHIQDSKGNIYSSFYTNSSEMIAGYATAEVGLPKGTYYVKMANNYEAYNKPYEFQVKYSASDYYEKEFNNSLSAANSIKLNQTYKGSLQFSSDKDFYKVVVPSDGIVNFQMTQKPNMGWYAHIQNSTGKVFKYIYTDYSDQAKGNAYAKVSLKKGTYYFQVSNNYDTANVPYSFKIYMQTPSLASNKAKITNNKGKKDTIQVSSLQKGDVVKVYNASSKGTKIAEKKSTGSSAALTVNQIGTKSGKLYITVTRTNMTESSRTAVSFSGEQTDSIKSSKVKITNNKGKKDTIQVSSLQKGDVVKVYNASSKGKKIAEKKSTGSSATLTVSQVGAKSEKLYITITRTGMKESSRTAVSFSGEQTDSIKSSQVKITNNKSKKDSITVSKLKKGDIVRIYTKSKGGKALAKSKAVPKTTAAISVTQLGKKAGSVYMTLERKGMKESKRVKVSYKAERK